MRDPVLHPASRHENIYVMYIILLYNTRRADNVGSLYLGKVSIACDIYALGVVCLEMLTSRKAYDVTHDPPSVVHAFEEAEEDNTVSGLLDSRPEVGWGEEGATGLVLLTKVFLKARGARRTSTAAVSASLLAECVYYPMPLLPLPPAPPTAEEEASSCVVCMDAPPSHAMIPCGHKCMCEGCVAEHRPNICHICRAPVTGTMRVYS
jgi:hypothetical protein